MACANGKETAFGRIHDYRICRVFQQSGLTRCALGDIRLQDTSKIGPF